MDHHTVFAKYVEGDIDRSSANDVLPVLELLFSMLPRNIPSQSSCDARNPASRSAFSRRGAFPRAFPPVDFLLQVGGYMREGTLNTDPLACGLPCGLPCGSY